MTNNPFREFVVQPVILPRPTHKLATYPRALCLNETASIAIRPTESTPCPSSFASW